MSFPLRCRCGALQGHLDQPQRAARAVCYCRDCQAYAHFLGDAQRVLDAQGGTDIIATSPHRIHFTRGIERLRCVSLSEKGLLRWYADCCRTPLGNTPRDPKLPYVGLVSACLDGSAEKRDAAFGPARAVLNSGSAKGKVAATPFALFWGMVKILRNVLGARLGRKQGENPFFEAGSGKPVAEPQVLTPVQRRALDSSGI